MASTTEVTPSERRSSASRARILEAAYEVVRVRGTTAMTLDAVADAAEVSKGGLLYHFPSKDALLRAMVDRLVGDYTHAVRTHAAADENPLGRSARSYVRAGTDTLRDADVWLALVAALGEGPNLLEPWREVCAGWMDTDHSEGVDIVSSTIARLATDGLWLADVLGVEPVDTKVRAKMLQRLEAMTEEPA
ncbi:MAG: TetR/AcrR family transcriptional regulator [Actinomycetota bacterium]